MRKPSGGKSKYEVTYIVVKNASNALGIVASNFFNNPSSQLKLVGVTGTNGKTTSATLMYNLFRMMGFKVGLISTVIYKVHNEEVESTHTHQMHWSFMVYSIIWLKKAAHIVLWKCQAMR